MRRDLREAPLKTGVGDKWGEVGRELGVGAKHSQCSENEGRGGAAGGGASWGCRILEDL